MIENPSLILSIALNPTIDLSGVTERILPTHKLRTHEIRVEPGGGGVNVAHVIKTLGGTCRLHYLAGGAAGRLLEDRLQQLGIDARRTVITGDTRIACNIRESSTGLEYRFVPDGPNTRMDELEALMERLVNGPSLHDRYVVFSGSLPPGLAEDTYARLTAQMAAHGARVILDTSGKPLRLALDAKGLFLIKPSLLEMQKLIGHEADESEMVRAARALIAEKCAEFIVISLGSAGGLLVGATITSRWPALPVQTVSAVGAGDSFVAALTLALARGRPVTDAVRYGCAAGAAAVISPGTEMCRREDVESLYPQSTLHAYQEA